MNYEGNIFRPPAEHDSVLLQVTIGCSNNKCLFCGMYKDKRFRFKDEKTISADILTASKLYKNTKRLFFCDGDALIMPQQRLLSLLREINEKLPWLTRIGSYANAKSIRFKTLEELKELRANKLSILYMGLESGDDQILLEMGKGVDVQTQVREALKVKEAGMKLSITVLLGLGGRKRSIEHAVSTGEALSRIDPNYIGALTLMLPPQVSLSSRIQSGDFETITPIETLQELKVLIEHTNITRGVFSANHASNFLPIQVRFPAEKKMVIQLLEKAVRGNVSLKHEFLRGL